MPGRFDEIRARGRAEEGRPIRCRWMEMGRASNTVVIGTDHESLTSSASRTIFGRRSGRHYFRTVPGELGEDDYDAVEDKVHTQDLRDDRARCRQRLFARAGRDFRRTDFLGEVILGLIA